MQLSKKEIKEMKERPDLSQVEISRFTPEEAVEELSDIAVRILCGAEVSINHNFNEKMVRLSLGGTDHILHIEDMQIAKWAADKAYREFIKPGRLELMTISLPYMLQCRKWVRSNLIKHYEKEDNKLRVLFLRGDNTGCGYWRIKLPAEYLKEESESFNIHISDLEINYDRLVEYDVIVVQRMFDFQQFYIMETLKKIGKKIIYEIDDDIFNIESHNPAAQVFRRYDTQLCIQSLLNISDAVIITTKRLAQALNVEDKAIIYPNSIDWDSHFLSGFKDPNKTKTRIFWSGSNTHDEDFNDCIPALQRIFSEREDVELFVMGSCPKKLSNALIDFKDRILICPGMHTEAYFHFINFSLDADIGIIPLANTLFNHGKSTCKGLEYTMAGIPIVASNTPPYSDVYEDGKDALMCKNKEEWYNKINKLLENKKMREQLINEARKTAVEKFHIKNNVKNLEEKILDIGKDILSLRNSKKKQIS